MHQTVQTGGFHKTVKDTGMFEERDNLGTFQQFQPLTFQRRQFTEDIKDFRYEGKDKSI